MPRPTVRNKYVIVASPLRDALAEHNKAPHHRIRGSDQAQKGDHQKHFFLILRHESKASMRPRPTARALLLIYKDFSG